MAIFGLKSRKSYSSDRSALSKREHDPPTRNQNLEASDVIGDSPDFGQSNRRGPSHASDSSSLLSRNSTAMKKFFGTTRRKGSQSIDGGSPAGPPTKNLQASDYFNGANSKRASRTSLNKPATTPSSPPVITPSAIAPSLSTPAGQGGSFAEAVGQNVPDGLAASPAATTAPTGPRPSELFAGKGVKWDHIDLTARDVAKPTDTATPATIDMQKFLKERRQWIPTFKDSDTVEEASVTLPSKLEQFSFDTPAEVSKSSAGLKSLKDLEDTHKRKAALLNPAPLASAINGAIFEEAGPSTSALSSSVDNVAQAGQKLPPPPAAPTRNQSFRTSPFAASSDNASRKSASLNRKPVSTAAANGASAVHPAAASRDIPKRRSSVRKGLSDLEGKTDAENPTTTSTTQPDATAARSANGRVDQIKERAGVSETSATASAATGSVRPSMETGGFATPAGTQSHDGEHTNQGGPAVEVLSAPPSTEATYDSNITVGPPTSPPRPPKNEQRTPSRQNSKEPINGGQVASLVERIAEAAPSLQNVVPGTGAATSKDA
ncbi:uncharacterized protein MEPE_06511 [Melanopsichium pennsylvanicum]|uniref:Uncharacterized protein n=2 Tax=Melanopsichium pennsylvanicum TaxID=63383 RepID=A0AAJ4XS06_9BASI|nr:putative protein [Melanopsichium pennsylvanicum 4]SNX87800.1 uncharacterized protein MEPE_06511 [Melanopsichium pennsylvanicum]